MSNAQANFGIVKKSPLYFGRQNYVIDGFQSRINPAENKL